MRSMTAYGQNEISSEKYKVKIEIKSVNHRYFEFSARISRVYSFLEDRIKRYLQQQIFRGKVEVFVFIEALEDSDMQMSVNYTLADHYMSIFKEMEERYERQDNISLASLLKMPDVLSVQKVTEDEDSLWQEVEPVLEAATRDFLNMRENEGAHLKEDIQNRVDTIHSLVEKIEEESDTTVEKHQEKIRERLSELLEDTHIDEQRLLTEIAIFADKIAIEEETVRLKSHFNQMAETLQAGEAIGRKLDFLVQEMNREINTIGSKAQNSQIAYMVVDVKAEIEKIREQIQNIE